MKTYNGKTLVELCLIAANAEKNPKKAQDFDKSSGWKLGFQAEAKAVAEACTPQWTKLADAVPETFRDCQLSDGVMVVSGYNSESNTEAYFQFHNRVIFMESKDVTHWMYFSAPPEKAEVES